MVGRNDHIREIQKFASSQYWNSGMRITAGVMLPLLVLVKAGWLADGIPFLWGALFVSLTDTPGPIHHRRNGMLAAILLNATVVALTTFTGHYQPLLVIQIIVAGFFLSMLAIYGARGGAVGSLALVLMLLNLLTTRDGQNFLKDGLLIAGGGSWYMVLSLMLYRIRPYRLVEQGLGEHIIAIADYIRARATLYKESADVTARFGRVIEAQRSVQKIQAEVQELLFKTRKFVADASPKSRSMMMIYLDSLDLYEQTMHSYQNYEMLHKTLAHTGLLARFYGLILELGAELELVGIAIQTGRPVKRQVDLTAWIDKLHDAVKTEKTHTTQIETTQSLNALENTLDNIQNISNRLNKLILYTRLEVRDKAPAQQVNQGAVSQPITVQLLLENLTLSSNIFRHAIRITVAIITAYVVADLFSLIHSYWVLLTIVTIMKPVYSTTRKRNVQRVTGTLTGVILVTLMLYFIHNQTILLVIMVVSMLIGYSLLRVNYFIFVVFLTIFVIVSFHFLNPLEFKSLIVERLVDTAIGSFIAALASRFILPVWGSDEIKPAMVKMLEANRRYFISAWHTLTNGNTQNVRYNADRKNAVVALSNLSENFQHMLAEPRQTKESPAIHQFVIANHMLISHIATLSVHKMLQRQGDWDAMENLSRQIVKELDQARHYLDAQLTIIEPEIVPDTTPLRSQMLNPLVMIHTLARDINKIVLRMQ